MTIKAAIIAIAFATFGLATNPEPAPAVGPSPVESINLDTKREPNLTPTAAPALKANERLLTEEEQKQIREAQEYLANRPKATRGRKEWTRWDTGWEIACEALLVADWIQTRNGDFSPGAKNRKREENKILGPYPSKKAIDRYCLTAIALHPIIAYALPQPWRGAFQAGTIGIQIIAIGSSVDFGVKIRF